jgi:molybdate transport system substrate-binding protein
MDYLQNKKRVAANDRINLLGNRLVLITPKGQVLAQYDSTNLN